MEGATLRQQQALDTALFTAWHTAIFALNGYAGKLKGKSLGDFLSGEKTDPKHAHAIAFFHRLKARGVDVQITRNEIN